MYRIHTVWCNAVGIFGTCSDWFVHLQHEKCIKSKQVVGIGSSNKSVGCEPSSPCCHLRPTTEVYWCIVMRIVPNHHVVMRPFIWNDNVSLVGGKFSGFPLLEEKNISCSIYRCLFG